MSALDDLTRKLGLLQTVSKDAAKKWAQRTRAVKAGNKWDQAAMIAATELFPSEFDPIGYRREAPSIEALVRAIENLR